MTWLQYYNQTFARDIPTNEVYGREYSVFNFGLPTAHYEGFSREVSIYNGQSPPLVAVPQEVYSREVSVFNFGLPSAPVEAIAREVSVYNGQSPPLVAVPEEVYSREVSVFNFGESPSSIEADSREVSVFNFVPPLAARMAIRAKFQSSTTFLTNLQKTHEKPHSFIAGLPPRGGHRRLFRVRATERPQ